MYYITPHYEKYPMVLAQALEELLDVAWVFVGSRAARKGCLWLLRRAAPSSIGPKAFPLKRLFE